ncbi:unnamed protein product [Pieris macdunnoughi]|uniref:Uncharacterized protein n=1 Tax=Pieris macdunnoughi TaxID=345717 RepID=A0A821PGK5_9NEOP|nr:unnamed protein product [Pieris macdunnoughi]
MTIKNKKTKSSTSEVTSSKSASSSVQKTSTSTSVQKSSNTLQKVSSSGKKVRYIDVKVEQDDPLMITDISDHASISGSTVSELYNSHPHYIITEAPSVSDLSQTRTSNEIQVSDMAQSTTGEFVSNSSVHESSSTSQHQTSRSENIQTSSTVEHSGSSHSQTFDRTADSSSANQTLNTAFIDSSGNQTNSRGSFLSRSQGANATDSFIQSERQNLSKTGHSSNVSSDTSKGNVNIRGNERHMNIPDDKVNTLKTNPNNFYGGEGTLDKNKKTNEFSSTSHSSQSKSSNVTKSSSSSYVVEIVDGKERIVDKSQREWGDAKEHATNEEYVSVSGTNIKPQSAYSAQNYDMQSKYDSGKDGARPINEMTVREDSKYIKDGKQLTSHESVISQNDNSIQQQFTSTQNQITSDDHYQSHVGNVSHNLQNVQSNSENTNYNTMQNKNIQSNTSHSNIQQKDIKENVSTHHENRNNQISTKRNVNQTDSSNFYGYDSTIQDQLRKVGNILQVPNTENINYSTKILKSNTSSAQQASSSSYVFEVVDGKQRVIDSAHREWGDSKEHSTHEKSHNISGTGIKPEHEYSRQVLDKESYYDTGKDGIPKSASQISEESAMYKNGVEIASKRNVYASDLTKKQAITEHPSDYVEDRYLVDENNRRQTDSQDIKSDNVSTYVTDSDNIRKTTELITNEKQNISKESSSKTTSETKDTLTSYERSTGTWNGKFTYETEDDRPKRPKQVSPFGRSEQPRHHLKRQDTEENIIISSRDIKDFTSISDLRKIIETSQTNKDVTVSNKNIVIRRNIDDRVLKEILETVKKYPFKRIDKVTFGTKINEDVKDLYEGIDTEETTVLSTTTGEKVKKSFEVDKTRSQIEVTRYITENGITRKETIYEDAKEDDKVKTDVFVDNSSLDIKNLKDVRTTKDVYEYDVVDHATTNTTREDIVSSVYDETIIDDRKTVRDDTTVIRERYTDETRPRPGGPGGPRKPEKVCKEQCICEICTCG